MPHAHATMKLWVVRHAKPLLPSGVCYGSTDVRAEDQATQQAAENLAAVLPHGLTVRSSTLQRCEHLSTYLRRLRPDLILKTDPRIAEMHFGAWEGRPWADLPKTEIDAWAADFAHHRPGGGDDVQAFMRRVHAALADELRSGAHEAVWITHAGVARALRLIAQGIPLPTHANQWPREAPAFGQWEVVEFSPPAPPNT